MIWWLLTYSLFFIELIPQIFIWKFQSNLSSVNSTKFHFNYTEQPFKYPDSDHKKPPVPRVDEMPVMGMRTNKNFITQNAVENIMAVPKKPERAMVDSRKGNKQLLEPSGLEPVFLQKKVVKTNDSFNSTLNLLFDLKSSFYRSK